MHRHARHRPALIGQEPWAKGMDVLAVVVTLLAPFLGGSTKLWQQAIVIGAGALLMLLDRPRSFLSTPHRLTDSPTSPTPPTPPTPPTHRPTDPPTHRLTDPPTHRPLPLPLLALLILGYAAFLPSRWFSVPLRQTLIANYEVSLAPTVSMQPWLTLENVLLLSAGVAWAIYLAQRQWTLRRPLLLSIYVAGLLALIVTDLVLHMSDVTFTLWKPQSGFGFFPNRNQTGDLIGIGAIVLLGLTFQSFHRRKAIGFLWITGYLVSLIALIVTGSRAGPILFFLGSLAWVLWVMRSRRHERKLGAGLSIVLLLLTSFLLFGGRTLERFTGTPSEPASLMHSRLLMHADALRLIKDAPWIGIGAGNFPPVFAHYRVASAAQNWAIHPESDWLWLGAEMGVLAPVLALLAVGLWLRYHWPNPKDPHFYLLAAIVVSAIAFVAHGFMDVSAHRMGTLWPMIFLLSLLGSAEDGGRSAEDGERSAECGRRSAEFDPIVSPPHRSTDLPAHRSTDPPPHRSTDLPTHRSTDLPAWSLIGAFWLTISGLWLAAACGAPLFPNSATQDRIRAALEWAQKQGSHYYAIHLADQGLRFMPLDWGLYFDRALARSAVSTNLEPVLMDLVRARFLEPNVVEVPFVEGKVWLAHNPVQALAPWSEALRRAGTNKAGLYQSMLSLAAATPEIRNDLRAFALDNPALLIVFLEQATPQEIAIEIERVQLEDPDLKQLTPAQKRRFFSVWQKSGDRQALIDKLQAHPDWVEFGWFAYANALADQQRFEEACRLADRHTPAPVLPKIPDDRPLKELQLNLLLVTNDFAIGYALYQAHLAKHDPQEALLVLRKLTADPGCPAYFWYLTSQLEMKLEDWRNGWNAWKAWNAFAVPSGQ